VEHQKKVTQAVLEQRIPSVGCGDSQGTANCCLTVTLQFPHDSNSTGIAANSSN